MALRDGPTHWRPAPSSTREEGLMRRSRTPSRPLVIRSRFEPSHLAAASLVEAYACLVPIRHRPILAAPPPRAVPLATTRQEGGSVR